MKLKAGREVLDPCNRVVCIIEVRADGWIRVKLAGPYGATILYWPTMLRPVPEDY